MPVEFTSTVIPFVEILHLWDQILQLCGKRHKDLLTASGPGSSI